MNVFPSLPGPRSSALVPLLLRKLFPQNVFWSTDKERPPSDGKMGELRNKGCALLALVDCARFAEGMGRLAKNEILISGDKQKWLLLRGTWLIWLYLLLQ